MPERYVIPGGTPLRTDGGHAIGKAVADLEVGRPAGDQACIDVSFALIADATVHAVAPLAHEPTVRACAPSGVVEHRAAVAPTPAAEVMSHRTGGTLGADVGSPK